MTKPRKTAQKIAVLMGGWSAERKVSLSSGAECAKALRQKGYEVTEVDVTRDLRRLLDDLTPAPDAVFNALHGQGGEDGCIQGVLDYLGLPYTHSGRMASAIAMDKLKTRELLEPLGVPFAEGRVVDTRHLDPEELLMPCPYVVKPVSEGSSVGVRIIRAGDNRGPLGGEWHFGHCALVEKYIPGKELSVAVMGTNDDDLRALTVTEIIPATEFYDYEAKYSAGGSRHVLPAPIAPAVFDEARRLAAFAHRAIGCTGVTRSDFRYDDSQPGTQGLVYLEINTQPGMTPTSLVPEQAQHLGISFPDLVSWMVENAQCHA